LSAETLTDITTPDLYNSKDEGMFKREGSGNLTAKNYAATNGLIRFHSWRPMYTDPEYTFSLYGDNVLNTFHT
jgi:hypothetical protein